MGEGPEVEKEHTIGENRDSATWRKDNQKGDRCGWKADRGPSKGPVEHAHMFGVVSGFARFHFRRSTLASVWKIDWSRGNQAIGYYRHPRKDIGR